MPCQGRRPSAMPQRTQHNAAAEGNEQRVTCHSSIKSSRSASNEDEHALSPPAGRQSQTPPRHRSAAAARAAAASASAAAPATPGLAPGIQCRRTVEVHAVTTIIRECGGHTWQISWPRRRQVWGGKVGGRVCGGKGSDGTGRRKRFADGEMGGPSRHGEPFPSRAVLWSE